MSGLAEPNEEQLSLGESLREALAALRVPANKPLAEAWLNDFQRNEEAWSNAFSLLTCTFPGGENEQEAVHIFCAQVLKFKVQNNWSELPPDKQQAFIQGLIDLVLATPSQFVRTQLFITVSSIAFLLPDWTNVIESMREALPDHFFLEFVKVYPEELEYAINGRRITKARFKELVANLSSEVVALFGVLYEILNSQDSSHEAILLAVYPWVKGPTVREGKSSELDLPFETIEQSGVAKLAFHVVVNQRSNRALWSAGIGVVRQLAVKFAEDVFEEVLQLREVFEVVRNTGDVDVEARNDLINVFVETAENAPIAMTDEMTPGVAAMLEILLMCTADPNKDSASLCFFTWDQLMDWLEKSSAEVNNGYQEYLLRMLDIITTQVVLPDDDVPTSVSDGEAMIKFRTEAQDIIQHCARDVVGWAPCMHMLYEMLQQVVDQKWQQLEAVLFSIQFVGDAADVDDKDAQAVVGEILGFIPQLNFNTHLTLRAMGLLDEFAHWLGTCPHLIKDLLVVAFAKVERPYNEEEMNFILNEEEAVSDDSPVQEVLDIATRDNKWSRAEAEQVMEVLGRFNVETAGVLRSLDPAQWRLMRLPTAVEDALGRALSGDEEEVTRLEDLKEELEERGIEARSKAIEAITTISRTCGVYLREPPLRDDFLELFNRLLDGDNLSMEDRISMHKPMGHMIHNMAAADAAQAIRIVAEPVIGNINEVVQDSGHHIQAEDVLNGNLKCLGKLISACNNKTAVMNKEARNDVVHPCVQFVAAFWDDFNRMLNMCVTWKKCVDVFCENVLRPCLIHICGEPLNMYDNIIVPMMQYFETTPHGSFLSVGSYCLSGLAEAERFDEAIEVYNFVSSCAFQKLLPEGADYDMFTAYPAVVQHLFLLQARAVFQYPNVFVSGSTVFETAVQCGLQGLKLQQAAAAHAVYAFFRSLFLLLRPEKTDITEETRAFLKNILLNGDDSAGQITIAQAIECAVMSRVCHSNIAILLTAVPIDYLQGWIYGAFQVLPRAEYLVDDEKIAEFISDIGDLDFAVQYEDLTQSIEDCLRGLSS